MDDFQGRLIVQKTASIGFSTAIMTPNLLAGDLRGHAAETLEFLRANGRPFSGNTKIIFVCWN